MSNFLPNALINRLKTDPDFDIQAFLDIHDREQTSNSIRLNPNKLEKRQLPFIVQDDVPWCSEGYYLEDRPIYTLDPLFHAGAYYPQEASSMFLAYAIQQIKFGDKAIRALDLCAAPGGKSTLTNDFLSSDSLLVSNEIIKARANILEENMVKWGSLNVIITNNDPSSFGNRLPGYFDLVVVDAPCSGSGMFRKDNSAIDHWSEASVKLCAERQKRILADSVDTIKEGGYLFYSTCSYSVEENEEIVDWVISELGFESVSLEVPSEWMIEKTESPKKQASCFRFYPHKLKGEGFFFSVLRKVKAQETFNRRKIKKEKNNAPKQVIANWMKPEAIYPFLHNEILHALPENWEDDFIFIGNVLYLKNVGTRLGKWTGKELLPAHDLALSNHINRSLPFLELEESQALNYLRKRDLDPSLNASGKTGWYLIRYKGVNLGWVKLLPNRINNYYPKESRIQNL